MRIRLPAMLAATLTLALPAAAQADEIYGGGYAHGVDTPFTFDTGEGGADLQLGYRFDPIAGLEGLGGPQPYVFGSVNSGGDTNFAGVGVAGKRSSARSTCARGSGW